MGTLKIVLKNSPAVCVDFISKNDQVKDEQTIVMLVERHAIIKGFKLSDVDYVELV